MTDTAESVEKQLKWMAFMAHIPIENADYIEATLKEYDIGGYIIGIEETPYHHFHFIVEMTENHYHNFSKRVFKDKFNLRGRATKGLPRQYGRVKEIQNLERLKAYTLKDGNFRTNMTEEQIQKYIDISFKKNEQKTLDESLLNDLYEIFHDYIEIDPKTKEEVMCPARGREVYKWVKDQFTGMAGQENIYKTYTESIEMELIPIGLLRKTIIDLMKVWEYKAITKAKVESLLMKYLSKQEEITTDMIYQILYS